MNILFTKKINEQMISENVGNHFSYDFVEVIQIKFLKIEAFDLDNKSIIFTSLNAVRSFFQNQFKIENNNIYCVGEKSANFLKSKEFSVSRTEKNADDLANFIIENSKNEKFVHFAGDLSLDILNEKLKFNGISYQKEILYTTELLNPKIEENYDALVFFSPSGVRSFAQRNSLENKVLFSIGKTTEKELQKFTKQKIFTSSENNLQDLLKLIKSHEITDF